MLWPKLYIIIDRFRYILVYTRQTKRRRVRHKGSRSGFSITVAHYPIVGVRGSAIAVPAGDNFPSDEASGSRVDARHEWEELLESLAESAKTFRYYYYYYFYRHNIKYSSMGFSNIDDQWMRRVLFVSRDGRGKEMSRVIVPANVTIVYWLVFSFHKEFCRCSSLIGLALETLASLPGFNKHG